MYWLCTIGSHKCIKCPKNCAKLAARCLDSKNNTFAVFSVCIFWYWAWDEFSVRWDSLNGMRKGGADLEKKIKPCSVLYHIFFCKKRRTEQRRVFRSGDVSLRSPAGVLRLVWIPLLSISLIFHGLKDAELVDVSVTASRSRCHESVEVISPRIPPQFGPL